MTDCLLEKRDDGVALITLNRPERFNAISDETRSLLAEYLAACAQDKSVRCLALTGAGKGFCSGGDVQQQAEGAGDVETPRTKTEDSLNRRVAGLQEGHMQLPYMLHTMAKPTVALVNGAAAGAGLALALACDIRFCSDKASFHTAFSKVGLSGDCGGSYFLQRLIGYGRAIELFYAGDRVDAEQALALGIANHMVPHDEFPDAGLAFCRKLAEGPTAAYANIKANFLYAETANLEDALAQEARTMIASGQTRDHAEGARSFVERRTPRFTGE
jgi:2-(1,2-epoxy-1,2-dihydrophenyl)acetyl-CoA isomerase